MKLYSYCLRYDDGAAPNPYWGECTLAICKPVIRRTAAMGDWVLGHGSMHSPLRETSREVIYAMKVTKILSMKEYDEYCRTSVQQKIPDWTNSDFRRKMGDCIYDYSRDREPKLRRSIHTEDNRTTDLSGEKVLLSTHFYYFGDNSIPLPLELHAVLHPTQGHKSHANERQVGKFVAWIEGGEWQRNCVLGEPQLKGKILSEEEEACRAACARQHKEQDEADEICALSVCRD